MYKNTYFRLMAEHINHLTIGRRIHPFFGRETFRNYISQPINAVAERKDKERKCMVLARVTYYLNLPENAGLRKRTSYLFKKYMRAVASGYQPKVIVDDFGFGEEEVSTEEFERMRKHMDTVLSTHSLGDVGKSCLETTKDIVDVHTNIVMFNRSVLSAPEYKRGLTLWRYIVGIPGSLVRHQYSQLGETVPVDRFLSTGFSPIDVRRGGDDILLRIDLPPEFPFWILSSSVGETVSLEHREVVLPYTLDFNGETLNYGLYIKKVVKAPVVKTEGTILKPGLLINVTPRMLDKPIKLQDFHPRCGRMNM
jgi:hypothetical protein